MTFMGDRSGNCYFIASSVPSDISDQFQFHFKIPTAYKNPLNEQYLTKAGYEYNNITITLGICMKRNFLKEELSQ